MCDIVLFMVGIFFLICSFLSPASLSFSPSPCSVSLWPPDPSCRNRSQDPLLILAWVTCNGPGGYSVFFLIFFPFLSRGRGKGSPLPPSCCRPADAFGGSGGWLCDWRGAVGFSFPPFLSGSVCLSLWSQGYRPGWTVYLLETSSCDGEVGPTHWEFGEGVHSERGVAAIVVSVAVVRAIVHATQLFQAVKNSHPLPISPLSKYPKLGLLPERRCGS